MRKIKNVTVQVKAGEADGLAEGQVTAYASVFGNIDSYGDVVIPGAFTADIEERKAEGVFWPVLFGHNMGDPDYNLGIVIDAQQDGKGLLVTVQFDLSKHDDETYVWPKAYQTYMAIKGRRIRQLSFAYDVIESAHAKQDGQDVLELRVLKVYEISFVTVGANQETEVIAVKTAVDLVVDGIKAGRVLSAKNETAIQESIDSISAAITRLQELLPETDPDVTDDAESEETTDQEKAIAPEQANDEETSGSKSEEPRPGTPAKNLAAAQLTLLSLSKEIA